MVKFIDSVTFFMLPTSLLNQGQIFADSHRYCAVREGVNLGLFGVERSSDETFCPSTVTIFRIRATIHERRNPCWPSDPGSNTNCSFYLSRKQSGLTYILSTKQMPYNSLPYNLRATTSIV